MSAIASTSPAAQHVPLSKLPQPIPNSATQDTGKSRDSTPRDGAHKVDLAV